MHLVTQLRMLRLVYKMLAAWYEWQNMQKVFWKYLAFVFDFFLVIAFCIYI